MRIFKKLFKRSRLDIRKFVFSNRVVDKWNLLSDCCIICTTVKFQVTYFETTGIGNNYTLIISLESGLYMALPVPT